MKVRQLTLQQDAIMAILLHQYPWRVEVHRVFVPIRAHFIDADHFIDQLDTLYAMDLIRLFAPHWSNNAWISLTDDGIDHCKRRLEEQGLTLQQFRLTIQAAMPGTFDYGEFSLVDRVSTCLADLEQQMILRAMESMSVTGEFARVM